eukprot:750130-Hanusia_phi.AAC.4
MADVSKIAGQATSTHCSMVRCCTNPVNVIEVEDRRLTPRSDEKTRITRALEQYTRAITRTATRPDAGRQITWGPSMKQCHGWTCVGVGNETVEEKKEADMSSQDSGGKSGESVRRLTSVRGTPDLDVSVRRIPKASAGI